MLNNSNSHSQSRIAERPNGKLVTTKVTNEHARAINGLSPRLTNGSGDASKLSREPVAAIVWDRGPEGEANYSDHRYWLRRANRTATTAQGEFAKQRYQEAAWTADAIQPDLWFTATNIAERIEATIAEGSPGGTHTLLTGTIVHYWPGQDRDGNVRFEFDCERPSLEGKIVCRGPNNEPDRVDNFYWVQLCRVAPGSTSDRIILSAIPPTPGNPTIVLVENFAERADRSHSSSPGTPVQVHMRADADGTIHRYMTYADTGITYAEECPQPNPKYCVERWEILWHCEDEEWQDEAGDPSDPVMTDLVCAERPGGIIGQWRRGAESADRIRHTMIRVSEFECTPEGEGGEPCEPIGSGPSLPDEPEDCGSDAHCYHLVGGYWNCEAQQWENLAGDQIDQPFYISSSCNLDADALSDYDAVDAWYVQDTLAGPPKRIYFVYAVMGVACDAEAPSVPEDADCAAGYSPGLYPVEFPPNEIANASCDLSRCYHTYVAWWNCTDEMWENQEGEEIEHATETATACLPDSSPPELVDQWFAGAIECGPPRRVPYTIVVKGDVCAEDCEPNASLDDAPAFPTNPASACNTGFTGDKVVVVDFDPETCEATKETWKFVNGLLMCVETEAPTEEV